VRKPAGKLRRSGAAIRRRARALYGGSSSSCNRRTGGGSGRALETAIRGDLVLALLDLGIVELLDAPALYANEVVVVPAPVQFEHRLARFEVVSDEKTRLLELRKHAVNRREPGLGALLGEHFVDLLGREVPHRAFLEQLEYAQARQRRLQTYRFQVSG
jgi:hypothetical protein